MKPEQISIGETFVNTIDVGSGPVILLVHGFPLSHQMWKFQIETLSDRYRVIAPDLPGFGSSPVSQTPMSMQGLADTLAVMLESMGVAEPVAYCGLSMGGYVGWQFWKHHRQRLSNDIASPDHTDMLTRRFDSTSFEHLHDSVGRARQELRPALRNQSDVVRMKGVNVFNRVDRIQNASSIDLIGQRKLNENSADRFVFV